MAVLFQTTVLAQCHTGQHHEMQDYLKHFKFSTCVPKIMLTPETDVFTYMKTSSLCLMETTLLPFFLPPPIPPAQTAFKLFTMKNKTASAT